MQNRLLYIDIAKAFGLCMVILSHSVCPQIMRIGIGCYVPIFFIASGYTLGNFNILKRGKRLIGSYVCFSLLLLGLYILIQCMRHEPLNGIRNMTMGILYSRYALYPLTAAENINLLHIEYNAPLWFLTSMFTAYIALIPLLKWPKLRGGVIIVYIVLTWLLDHLTILLPWSIDCAFVMAIFIWIGIRLREIDYLSNVNRRLWIAIFVGYLFIAYLNGKVNLSIREYGYSILFCVISGALGSVLILRLSKWIETYSIGKCLSYVGQHSLTIFCIQMPLMVFSRVIIHKINIAMSIDIPTIAIALFQLVVAIFGGCLFDFVVHNTMYKIKRYIPDTLKS